MRFSASPGRWCMGDRLKLSKMGVASVGKRTASAVRSRVSPPGLHSAFAPLQREDGSSIYRRREADLYTSQVVLDAEARVLHAAGTQVIPALTRQRFDSVAASFQ